MPTTTTLARTALFAALVAAAPTAAEAGPRRLVVLDFDGPRALADTGRIEVVALLGEQYDVVARQRWESARTRAQHRSAGPRSWQRAAKASGVDAVIEGWVQDEGRHKLLTVAVREATTGQELDTVSVRIGSNGISENNRSKLQEGLDGVLAYVEGSPDPVGNALKVVDTRVMVGARSTRDDRSERRSERRASDDDDEEAPPRRRRSRLKRVAADDRDDRDDHDDRDGRDERDDRDDDRRERSVREAGDDREAESPGRGDERVAATTENPIEAAERSDLVSLFGATSDEGRITDPTASHTPVPTPRFRVSGGGYYGSRSLNIVAENQTGVTPYAGVPSKGLELNAIAYPFPSKKLDGRLSGIGFSLTVNKSAGSEVTFDDGDTVSEYVIDQAAYRAGIHYRQPLADLVSLDGSLSYGKSSYLIPDAPEAFEVPDVNYSYLGAAAHLDLHITQRASVGFGAKYFYLLDVGDVSSVDWYGPGRASGLGLDADFVVPLPKSLYLRGALAYDRFKIVFDGVGVITEEEGVSESRDSTVNGSLNLGIQF